MIPCLCSVRFLILFLVDTGAVYRGEHESSSDTGGGDCVLELHGDVDRNFERHGGGCLCSSLLQDFVFDRKEGTDCWGLGLPVLLREDLSHFLVTSGLKGVYSFCG